MVKVGNYKGHDKFDIELSNIMLIIKQKTIDKPTRSREVMSCVDTLDDVRQLSALIKQSPDCMLNLLNVIFEENKSKPFKAIVAPANHFTSADGTFEVFDYVLTDFARELILTLKTLNGIVDAK